MRSLLEDLRLQSSKIEALSKATRFPADSKRLSQNFFVQVSLQVKKYIRFA